MIFQELILLWNFMSARRDNQGKPEWSLVDFKSLIPMVRVLEFGRDKYSEKTDDGTLVSDGRDNWKKGLLVRKTCESLLRHVFAYLNGEDADPESGISHVGHIQCNSMFLGRFDGTEWDDRGKSDKTQEDKIIVEIRGGVAYCIDPRVKIMDFDNEKI